MLITFKTKSYANIVMFGEVGLTMLEMMDYGTSIPGAIVPENVSHALSNLQRGLESVKQTTEPAGETDEEQPVTTLPTRALPLIKLLQSAIDEQNHVRWE